MPMKGGASRRRKDVLGICVTAMSLRAFPLSKAESNQLLALHERGQVDPDKLDILVEAKLASELSLWSGPTGASYIQVNGEEHAIPQSHIETGALVVGYKGFMLLRRETDWSYYSVQLQSAFECKQLHLEMTPHQLQRGFSWSAGEPHYGDEVFDEYEWGDGSTPVLAKVRSDTDYFLLTPKNVIAVG